MPPPFAVCVPTLPVSCICNSGGLHSGGLRQEPRSQRPPLLTMVARSARMDAPDLQNPFIPRMRSPGIARLAATADGA